MRDLNDVLDLNLHLPIGGKTYLVKPPDAATGVQLMNRLVFGLAKDGGVDLGPEQRSAVEISDEQLPDFGRQCLGDTLDELMADGVPWPQLEFTITTAFYAWTLGKAYAEHYWETAGKQVGPAEESLEAPPTATPTRPVAESTIPSSASASGTSPNPRA